MGKALLVTTDGLIKDVELDFNDNAKFREEVLSLIGNNCDYYECAECTFLNNHFNTVKYPTDGGLGYAMLIDEMGKMVYPDNVNRVGTLLYSNEFDYIVGNVIICAIKQIENRYEWDYTALPDVIIQFVKSFFKCE